MVQLFWVSDATASQIPNYALDYTLNATVNNSVLFDWANNNAFISQTYVCTYSIQGCTLVSEFNPKNESHFIVPNLLRGQSVTLALTSASHPCVPSQTRTCSVACGASIVIPIFALPASSCLNEATTNLPSTSTNAITGTWSLAIVNTSTVGTTNYDFTPDLVKYPCAKTKTLSVAVGPVEPDFSDFAICLGKPVPPLNSISPNGIIGTWNPPTVDNTAIGSHDFTPFPRLTCSPTVKKINVTVNPSDAIVNLDWIVTDAFAKNQIVTVTQPMGVDYLYQLDEGPFQESPVFEYVFIGTHSITVKDRNNCGVPITRNTVLVIGYPKYFTPNNDGVHDN